MGGAGEGGEALFLDARFLASVANFAFHPSNPAPVLQQVAAKAAVVMRAKANDEAHVMWRRFKLLLPVRLGGVWTYQEEGLKSLMPCVYISWL